MSVTPSRGLAVVDAGTKAVSLDSGPPVLPPEVTAGVQMEFVSGGDEHGKLLWPQVRRLVGQDVPCLHFRGRLKGSKSDIQQEGMGLRLPSPYLGRQRSCDLQAWSSDGCCSYDC